MIWIHPALQFLCLMLAVHVLHMGINRFRFQHLKQKAPFNWKQHVHYGKIVAGVWLAGWLLGVQQAVLNWGTSGLTGPHYTAGMYMVPLILVGLVTGYLLQKPSGKRPGLALFHGVVNLVVFILGLYQTWTGVAAIKLFMLS